MIAFVCDQSVQVMRAIQIHLYMEEFKGDADIYIGSSFYDSKNIAKRLQEENIFRRVIWIDKNKVIPEKAGVIKLMYGKSELSGILRQNKYSVVVSFNLDNTLATVLYNLNKRNAGFSCQYVEDGPGLYNIHDPERYGKTHPYYYLGIDKPFFHTDKWWFSEPDLMEVPSKKGCKGRLPYFQVGDDNFTNIINRIYKYKYDVDLEKADVLIMEESFYTDGKITELMNDFEIYLTIKKAFPKANFLVKLHPRTKVNRFASDFKIMEDQSIPWEVYVLNLARAGREIPIQIGIRCNTLQSDKLGFGIEGKKISLARMFLNKIKSNSRGDNDVDEAMLGKLYDIKKRYRNIDNFQIVQDKKELLNILKGWLAS